MSVFVMRANYVDDSNKMGDLIDGIVMFRYKYE